MSEVLRGMKYNIYLNGTELDDFRYDMIQSVTYEDNATGSDLLTIEIEDPEFIFIDDNIFLEDAKVKFVGGYEDEVRTMFEGYISIIDMSFPEDGSPKLTINCMDNTHLMNRVKKSRTWENMTRGQVARAIFQEYGFQVVIKETGNVQESIAQSKETDIQFLIKLADEEIDPHLVYVEGNTGYYVTKEILESPQATLDYRDGNLELLTFSPSINKEVKQVEARTSEVNLYSHEVDKGQANDNTPRDVQGGNVSSTDRNNGKGSWVYSNGKWTQTY